MRKDHCDQCKTLFVLIWNNKDYSCIIFLLFVTTSPAWWTAVNIVRHVFPSKQTNFVNPTWINCWGNNYSLTSTIISSFSRENSETLLIVIWNQVSVRRPQIVNISTDWFFIYSWKIRAPFYFTFNLIQIGTLQRKFSYF